MNKKSFLSVKSKAKYKCLVRMCKTDSYGRFAYWVKSLLEEFYVLCLVFFWRSFRLESKYVLCRPQGGLNDILNQVFHCFCAAIFNRATLILDGQKSGILDSFEKYFVARSFFGLNSVYTNIPESLMLKSLQMTCHPSCLDGQGIFYASRYSSVDNYVETGSGVPLFVCSKRWYKASLIVHEQCGGGERGFLPFYFFDLQDNVRQLILQKLKILPMKYVGIHIRNSDVKTDYQKFLRVFKKSFPYIDTLVCTDSREALLYSQKFLDDRKIFSLSDIPDTNGESLHHNYSVTSWETNVSALADLFALARAEIMVSPSSRLGYQSGFLNLARSLQLRPRLINRMLLK